LDRLCRSDAGFIRAARAALERRRNVAELGDGQRRLGELVIMDHHFRRGVADDEL
jgi:hypothetical protein